ncbi:MAG: alpha-1,2-fucosyltransferase [Lachnospiraceae bacterium]|nr:alpha-1,2-fucosyltransferase [Lachnospiraceae bacterium]
MMHHVVRISDGLGNQMFQYAFAFALEKKTGVKVLIDPLFWGTSLRRYQLEEFHITGTKRLVGRLQDYILGFGPRNGRRFKDRYRQYLIQKKYQFFQEKLIMHYDADVYNQTKPCFFSGFWQTPQYFEEFYEELKKEFTRKEAVSQQAEKYQKQMEQGTSVAMHIRRTDYVRQEGNVTIPFDFYEEALRGMEKQLGAFRLFIFTDDKQFVKEYFKIREYVLVEGLCDLDEFEIMRQCNHHIVANSTFSWWAAYLGENKGGIVYAPCTGIWSEEFYPKEWILIKTQTEEMAVNC